MAIKNFAKAGGAAVVFLMVAACVTHSEPGIITPGSPTAAPIESVTLSQEQVSTPAAVLPLSQEQVSVPTGAPRPTPENESTKNLENKSSMALEEILAIELYFNTIDLAVELTNEIETVVPGQQVIYKISVTNNDHNPADGIRVTVELPSGISHNSNTALCDEQADGLLFCDLGYLEARKSREFLVAAVVDEGLPPDLDLTTNVSVDRINVYSREYFPDLPVWPDPVPENNSVANTMRLTVLEEGQDAGPQLWTVPIHLQEENNITDLKLSFWSSGIDGWVTAGWEFHYGIYIVNGSRPARDVRMSIDLPQRATYQPNGENCVQDAPYHLECVIGILKINETARLTIQMLSDDDLGEGVDGFVTISSKGMVENLAGPDLNPSDNTAFAVTRVKHDVELLEHFRDRRRRGY